MRSACTGLTHASVLTTAPGTVAPQWLHELQHIAHEMLDAIGARIARVALIPRASARRSASSAHRARAAASRSVSRSAAASVRCSAPEQLGLLAQQVAVDQSDGDALRSRRRARAPRAPGSGRRRAAAPATRTAAAPRRRPARASPARSSLVEAGGDAHRAPPRATGSRTAPPSRASMRSRPTASRMLQHRHERVALQAGDRVGRQLGERVTARGSAALGAAAPLAARPPAALRRCAPARARRRAAAVDGARDLVRAPCRASRRGCGRSRR